MEKHCIVGEYLDVHCIYLGIVGFVECELFLDFTMDELIHLFLNHQRVAQPVRMVGEVSIDVFVLFIVIYLGNL